jgi:uncharacterized protein (DUF1810 family)
MPTTPKLAEFVGAQNPVEERVLRERAAGHKESHWICFIFPQLAGLESSPMAQKFGLATKAEARSYFDHGPRLRECTRLMLAIPTSDIGAVLDHSDDLNLRSCMTRGAPRSRCLTRHSRGLFGGERDPRAVAPMK